MGKSITSNGESHPGESHPHPGDTLPLQRHSEEAAMIWPTPTPEETRPYEIINLDSNLMRFADSDTLQSLREYTHLTLTGVALPKQLHPSEQMVWEGVTLLNLILDLVLDTGNILEDAWAADMKFDPEVCAGPIMKAAWKATSEVVQRLLSDRSVKNVEAASRAIFAQTAQPPVFPPIVEGNALEIALSAQFLRWELVGFIAAKSGRILQRKG